MLANNRVYLGRKSGGVRLYIPLDMAVELGRSDHESIVLKAEDDEHKILVDLRLATRQRKARDDAY